MLKSYQLFSRKGKELPTLGAMNALAFVNKSG